MPTLQRLTGKSLALSLALSACSTSTYVPPPSPPVLPPPPVEASALRPCADLPLLNDGSLGDLIDWISRATTQYRDCQTRHAYATDWINTTRSQWTSPIKPPKSRK